MSTFNQDVIPVEKVSRWELNFKDFFFWQIFQICFSIFIDRMRLFFVYFEVLRWLNLPLLDFSWFLQSTVGWAKLSPIVQFFIWFELKVPLVLRKSNLISEKQIDHLIRYSKWAQFVWLFLLPQYSLPSSAQLKCIAPVRLGPTFSVCYKVPLPIFYCTTSILFRLVWPKFSTACLPEGPLWYLFVTVPRSVWMPGCLSLCFCL